MGGRRNESARYRHRNYLKKEYSLTSVPRSELEMSGDVSESKTVYNLDNHFGWTVLQKSYVGDNYFPHMSQYYQKPEIPGREDHQVTYVLVMEQGTVIDGGKVKAPKETQTTISGVQVEPPGAWHPEQIVTLPEENVRRHPPYEKRRKSSCFGGNESRSSRENSRGSRSSRKSRTKDKKNKDSTSRKDKKERRSSRKSNGSSQQSLEGEVTKELEKGKDRSKKKAKDTAKREMDKHKKKRTGPDRWQLRAPAGAELVKDEECEACEETDKIRASQQPNTNSKMLRSLKFTPKLSRKPTEHLMETPSGTNKYLFLGRSDCVRRN